MKNASAKSWSARGASRSWASFQNFHKFPYLPSRWVSLDWCSILRYANDGSVDVQADLRREIMTLKFEVGASSEKSCLWWSVNLSACGDLNCSYWGGLRLRKLVFNNWVFPRVVLGDGWRMVNSWNDRYMFGGFSLESSNTENFGGHQNKNFLNNSVELSMRVGPIETIKGHWQLSFVPINSQLAARGEGLKWWSVRIWQDLPQQFSSQW